MPLAHHGEPWSSFIQGKRFLLSVPVPPSCGGIPNWLQQFVIPQLISQGSQELLQGNGEIGVDFHRHQVHPPARIGGWALQEVVGDESDEDVHGDLCGIFPPLLNLLWLRAN
jgi:hypothetical protein